MDRHLNIFTFFNNHDHEYYEDNLSRGFALCLKYDTVLLDNILRQILESKLYSSLFNTDYPDYNIQIDIQKQTSNFSDFTKIIAIACSANEIDTSRFFKLESRSTGQPETDLSIEINDTCIIFEFKRTEEDCTSQLKCQAERIKNNCPPECTISYIDFNWKKIIKSLLNVVSLQKQINTENQFTLDFIRFLEKRHPDWFPYRLLSNISFPKDEADPNTFYLDSRLNQIKAQVFGNEQTKEITGKYYRLIISVDYGWANEIHVDSKQEDNQNYITVIVYPGDTKGQGNYLYKEGHNAIDWPQEIYGYKLKASPYLKFSHFNSGLFWYRPDSSEYQITHTRRFFDSNAGRYHKNDWNNFEILMNSINPKWRERCEYEQKIANSNRSYFDLSIGTRLTVYIPYKRAQDLDNDEIISPLGIEIKKIIYALKEKIDNS